MIHRTSSTAIPKRCTLREIVAGYLGARELPAGFEPERFVERGLEFLATVDHQPEDT